MEPAPHLEFEHYRALLFGIAYRMLGSAADAEDVLQEALLRWLGTGRAKVANPRAFLVTVVSRLCLDQLDSAPARRAAYVGPWLPEPVVTGPEADPDRISMAFMLLLERLSPAERAAFLLAEVLGYSFAEIAQTLGRSEEACRQLASRARKHVRGGREQPVDRAEHARVLERFLAACAAHDVPALEQLFAEDVEVRSDGGGKVNAARNVVKGANACARMMVGLTRQAGPGTELEEAIINGLGAVVLRAGGAPAAVLTLDVRGGRVHAVYLVNNPAKLALRRV